MLSSVVALKVISHSKSYMPTFIQLNELKYISMYNFVKNCPVVFEL